MTLNELDFELPLELIAERPCEPRDACRLLVIHRQSGRIEHSTFRDLSSYLQSGDLLVANSARVTPVRLFAVNPLKPSAKPIEILLTQFCDSTEAQAMISPGRKAHAGLIVHTQKTNSAIEFTSRTPDGFWKIRLLSGAHHWKELWTEEGHIPLPPYILKRRAEKMDLQEDRQWYQTTFAERDGAIAAPTAGLHFSTDLLKQLDHEGISMTHLFLKVGPGTFLPVKTPTLEEHVLLPEEFELPAECVSKIKKTRETGNRVVAVGTTVVRTLENQARHGELQSCRGQTDLMISPPFNFQVVDALITNFHLPHSTLLALVFAFGGTKLMQSAYQVAVSERYRFYSYGDAMLIL